MKLHRLSPFAVALLVTSAAPPARADPAAPPPDEPWLYVGVSSVLKNPVNLTTGSAGAVGLSYALNLSFTLSESTFLCVDVSAATPLSTFHPAPGVSAGPAWKLARRFILNPSLTYGYSPSYGGSADAHSLGLSVAPGFPLGNGVVVALPVIVSRNLTDDQTVLVFAFKVGFSIASI
jgi:hypothetical protein